MTDGVKDDKPTEIEILARQCRIWVDEDAITGSRADADVDNIPCMVTAFGPRLRTPQDLAELLRKLGMEIGEHSQEFNRTAREASPQPESESGCGRVAVNVVATGRAWADGNTARSLAEEERDRLLAERETTKGLVAELETKVKDLIDGHAIERSGLLADLGLCKEELTVARSLIRQGNEAVMAACADGDRYRRDIVRLERQVKTLTESRDALVVILRDHEVDNKKRIAEIGDLRAELELTAYRLDGARKVLDARNVEIKAYIRHADGQRKFLHATEAELIKLKADIVRMSEVAVPTTSTEVTAKEPLSDFVADLSERLDQVEAWMSEHTQNERYKAADFPRHMSADLPGKDPA